MNILLWVLQVALAWLCIAGGAYQIFKLDELKKNVASMRALPRGLWTFLGAFGCVAGLGLLLPGATGIFPFLTAYAAAAMAAHSLLVSSLYVYYRDTSPLVFSAAMAVLAAFISYARLMVLPL
jgi:ABC-type polysaccharide/polyol phosphate export permease